MEIAARIQDEYGGDLRAGKGCGAAQRQNALFGSARIYS
jgi:hypothetical protein